jgi:hypothetical protein
MKPSYVIEFRWTGDDAAAYGTRWVPFRRYKRLSHLEQALRVLNGHEGQRLYPTREFRAKENG